MRKYIIATTLLAASCAESEFGSGQSQKAQSIKAKPEIDPEGGTTGGATTGTTSGSTGGPGSVIKDEGEMCADNQPGFGGKVYQLPSGIQYLPDMSTLTPVGQIDAPQLNVPERDWTTGFPGIPNLTSYFGIRFYGVLKVPADGAYQFQTISDDGSKLSIDNNLVLNNDGIHAPRTMQSGDISLKAGEHKILIEWFQGPPKRIALQVYWRKSGQAFEIIPTSVVSHSTLCGITNVGQFK